MGETGVSSRCAYTRMHAHLSVTHTAVARIHLRPSDRRCARATPPSRRSSYPPSPAAPCIRSGIIYSRRGSIAIGRLHARTPSDLLDLLGAPLSREINARRAAGCQRRHDVIQQNFFSRSRTAPFVSARFSCFMGKRLTDSFHCEKNHMCSTEPRWHSFVAIDVSNTIIARFSSVYELNGKRWKCRASLIKTFD